MNDRRLAFFLPDLRGGGAERTMSLLANSLAERGTSIDFVLVQKRGDLVSTLKPQVRIVGLGTSSAYTCLPGLMRYLRRENPPVLISALDLTNFVAVTGKYLSGWKGRLFLRLDSTQSQIQRSPLKKRLESMLIRALYPHATRIIAVSQGVRDDFIESFPSLQERVQVIYNPIITADLQEKGNKPDTAHLLPPPKNPFFLGVGRLHPAKNFSLLLDAFSLVHQSVPSARLLILGEGEERSLLEARVQSLGLSNVVSLPGYVTNPYYPMTRAAAFVLSSNYEGLPTVLIEAMACGCPVIATDCPSGPREITGAGQYGHLVPVGDVQALASAMLKVLAGDKRLPPPDWLKPYRDQVVTEQYLELVFPTT